MMSRWSPKRGRERSGIQPDGSKARFFSNSQALVLRRREAASKDAPVSTGGRELEDASRRRASARLLSMRSPARSRSEARTLAVTKIFLSFVMERSGRLLPPVSTVPTGAASIRRRGMHNIYFCF